MRKLIGLPGLDRSCRVTRLDHQLVGLPTQSSHRYVNMRATKKIGVYHLHIERANPLRSTSNHFADIRSEELIRKKVILHIPCERKENSNNLNTIRFDIR